MPEKLIRLSVGKEAKGLRLDAYLASAREDWTRSRVASLIGAGLVLLDGRPTRPAKRLSGGETVEARIPEPEPAETPAQEIPLEILFEDGDVVVVNKPAGMVVHPSPGNPRDTLVNALLAHSDDLSGVGGVVRPGIVHRLDKGTSGAIVCAKNDRAHESLSAQFAGRTVEKLYLAVTLGATAFTGRRWPPTRRGAARRRPSTAF